jgi:SH3-like domain-containing protein
MILMRVPVNLRRPVLKIISLCALAVVLLASCKRGGRVLHGEPAYVSAPQVNLRDRLSAIYEKMGVLKNGERVEILEKSKHFVRVRSPRGEEGWVETRYLVGPEIFEAVDKLARDNTDTPVEGRGVARAELKMHVTPGRDTDALFRVDEGAKIEILKRAIAEKPQAKLTAPPEQHKPAAEGGKPAPAAAVPMEDWWLVRDGQHHAGWVLARMVDIDVPLDIAQYSEGQRIMAAFVLNQVPDVDPQTGATRQVPQFVTVTSENKDGLPWDYNQIRVFTWNAKRHRYETAYRERDLFGVFPVTVGHEVFDKEGDLPFFTVHVKTDNGAVVERKYKLDQPMVRRVLAPGEQAQLDAERAQKIAARRQARLAARAAGVKPARHKVQR